MLQGIKRGGAAVVLAATLGTAVGYSAATPLQTVHSQSAIVADSETDLLRQLYERVNPSVVSINVRIPQTASGTGLVPRQRGNQGNPNNPNDPNSQANPGAFAYAAGSGFVYDNQGHLVTNAHVVEGVDRIEITFPDGTQMHATVVGVDADSDLAVIKAEGDISKYAPLTLANSDTLRVGDRAIAIGNPFEQAGTMTQGIVSGLKRSVSGLGDAGQGQTYLIPNAIQTDAALNPGNSGGPLLNNNGEVIGVNEQIASQVRQSSGVSFAIPSNLVKQVVETLIKDGKIVHPWLGISGGSLSLDTNDALKLPANTHGAYVMTVQPGSPADKAGLKGAATTQTIADPSVVPAGGDIIVAIDKQPVKSFDDVLAYVFDNTKVGQQITVTVLRNGQQTDLQLTLGARPHNGA